MKWTLNALALLSGLALAGPGFAAGKPAAKPQPMTKQVFQAEKAKIEAEAKADRKLCDRLDGHRKDVCRAEAEGRAEALQAELEARYEPSPEATQQAKNVTAEANYAVAKVKCKALKGKAEDRCMKEAKLAREAAIRQAKVEKVRETGGPFASSAPRKKAPAGAS